MMRSKKIVFGITDCGRKFPNYENWIKDGSADVEVIKLSYRLNNNSQVEKCDAIILSGGHDVHPKFYNRQEYFQLLNPNDIDEQRDLFELRVIEETQKRKKPVLGICRGLQIANVFFGGTLIRDIPAFNNTYFHDKGEDENDSIHHIHVKNKTLLFDIVGIEDGNINSAHHQAADEIASDLISNSFSEEGIVEGLEWNDKAHKSPLMLVQWHPERILDQGSMFAKGIRDYILKEALVGK